MKRKEGALWGPMIISSLQLRENPQTDKNMRRYAQGSNSNWQGDRLGDHIDFAGLNLSEVVK